MAKKPAKSFRDLYNEGKSFPELVDFLEVEATETIKRLQSVLKGLGKQQAGLKKDIERQLRREEAELKTLMSRQQKHESIQKNKNVPASDRKEIAALERKILGLEKEGFSRSSLRSCKDRLGELIEKADRRLDPPKLLTTKNKAYRVGGKFSRQSVTRAYDGHVWEVLKGHFEHLPREKGQQATVKILAGLPEKREYLQLKQQRYTKNLESLVDDAYGQVEELRDELQEAFDNMPESLQETEVAQARYEAASQLDEIAGDQPSVPESISSLRIVHFPSLNSGSRAVRAANATDVLRAVLLATEQHMKETVNLKKAELEEFREFCEHLERHIDEIDSVEFPGMFG